MEKFSDPDHVAPSVADNMVHANRNTPTHLLLKNLSHEVVMLPGQLPAKGEVKTVTGSEAASKSGPHAPKQDKNVSLTQRVRHPPGANPSSSKWWTFELAATVLSFASFIALIIVLRRYDGQPQTEWPSKSLTLNGLVAILSTITQTALLTPVAAALSQSKWVHLSSTKKGSVDGRKLEDLELFDQASRGAWGSAQLLWIKRGQHLTAIGPILMILLLAFSTFTQQILSIQLRNIHVASAGRLPSIPRVETIDVGYYTTPFKLSSLMNVAVNNALISIKVSDLPVHCPTGNCTWPILPSLGVCGGCTDVTRNLSRTCNATSCSYRLPNGISATPSESLFTVLDYREIQEGPDSDYFYYTPVIYNNLRSGWTTDDLTKPLMKPGQLNDAPLYIRNFVTLGVPWQGSATEKFSATECALWVCVQADSVSVHNGYQSQETVSTWVRTRNPSGPYIAGQDVPGHVTFEEIPQDYNVLPGTNFTVTGQGWMYLVWAVNFFFRLGFVPAPGVDTSAPGGTLLALWRASSNLDSWLENFAQSVTTALRLGIPAANDNLAQYTGQAHSYVAFVKIRWAWSVFPAFLVIACFMFLLISMWQTRQRGIYAWKDSTLALLALGLDADLAKDAADSMNVPGELNRRIGDKRVYLDNGDGEWKLRLSN